MTVSVERLDEKEMAAHLDALADLRMRVFADYPYLYDGDMEYERDYIREFADEPGSVLVAARDGVSIVGAATASPLSAQKAEFQAPFTNKGYDVSRLFYFGESVLLPTYRGRGIGRAFFELREDAAREAGASHAAFCAVVRPDDHPRRPSAYRPLDNFWRSRGYEPVDGLTTSFDWQEHDGEGEVPHPMQFWVGSL